MLSNTILGRCFRSLPHCIHGLCLLSRGCRLSMCSRSLAWGSSSFLGSWGFTWPRLARSGQVWDLPWRRRVFRRREQALLTAARLCCECLLGLLLLLCPACSHVLESSLLLQ